MTKPTDKMQTLCTKAIMVEHARDERGNFSGWRALMFEIDNETGLALVLEIVEADTAREAAAHLCEHHAAQAIAVKVRGNDDDRTSDAVQIGRHWVVWPDALSTGEVAELLAA